MVLLVFISNTSAFASWVHSPNVTVKEIIQWEVMEIFTSPYQMVKDVLLPIRKIKIIAYFFLFMFHKKNLLFIAIQEQELLGESQDINSIELLPKEIKHYHF